MGIVGAICGYAKDDYLERVGWDRVRIGIALKSPVRRFRTGINLVNTKGSKYFRLRGEHPRIQIPHEFLKDAAYRIYLANGHDEAMEDLEAHLRAGTNVYTVSLGLAQCLADVTFVKSVVSHPVERGQHEVGTVAPMEQTDAIHYQPKQRYGLFRIPERMRPDRVVTKYGEVVVNEEGGTVSVETSQAVAVGGQRVLLF
jgi:CRISPR-associated protein Cas5h